MACPETHFIALLGKFGDCLYATPIARQIKQDNPQARVVWAIARKYCSVLDNNPYVDACFVVDCTDEEMVGSAWDKVRLHADEGLAKGIYQHTHFLQLPYANWHRLTSSIRKATLSGYAGRLTVPLDPVMVLTEQEKAHADSFAERHGLARYQHVVLVECAPSSGQSALNTDFCRKLAQELTARFPNSIFLLSGASDEDWGTSRVINIHSMPLRSLAALSHHCSMLLGGSSGITWLLQSTAAKPIPMMQVINGYMFPPASPTYDAMILNRETESILEIENRKMERLPEILGMAFQGGFHAAREAFHCPVLPDSACFARTFPVLLDHGFSFGTIHRVIQETVRNNPLCSFVHLYGHFLRVIWSRCCGKPTRRVEYFLFPVGSVRRRFVKKTYQKIKGHD